MFASLPQVERGVSKILGGDPKGDNFLYTNGKCVILRNIDVSTPVPCGSCFCPCFFRPCPEIFRVGNSCPSTPSIRCGLAWGWGERSHSPLAKEPHLGGLVD